MKNKIVSLLLCFVMCLGVFTSCARIVTAMEYEGKKLSVNIYSYWLSQIKSGYVSSADDTKAYWSTKYSDGGTYEEKMREIVDYNVKINLVCLKLFDDMGLTVTSEEKEKIETSLSDLLLSYGSKSELNSVLANYGINYNMLRDIYEWELKVSKVFESLYDENGPRRIDDATLEKYYKDNYIRVDTITLYDTFKYKLDKDGKPIYNEDTKSYEREALTDDEIDAKRALANDVKKKLDEGADFDELKKTYDESLESADYEYGYFICPNDLKLNNTEMFVAISKMEMGELMKVEDNGVICIIKRRELPEKPYEDEKYLSMFSNLVGYCEEDDFNDYMEELIADVKVYDKEIGKISIVDAPLMSY